MSLAKGKFGIEYNPRQLERESSGLGWLIALVAFVALVSLSVTIVKRVRSSADDVAVEPQEERLPAVAAESNREETAVSDIPPSPPIAAQTPALPRRPVKVRNLLMRLEEAERTRDVEMAVTTIETLRALPGSPAADIDDALARRLGVLNVRRLFGRRNAQWVKKVTVKRGDSASRLAVENGSTLASFVKLNGGDADKLAIGRTLYVMDHPRFNLVIHRRTRTADLSLNGKFFKRYDLQGEVKAKEGAYELPERKRAFWGNVGAQLKPADRDELELLLPSGTPVLISEM